MKFFNKIIIIAAMVSVATGIQAQTRIVPVQGWEADSIESANVGDKKFHSAIKGYATTTDRTPKYALTAAQGKGRWTLEPLAEIGVGTQSEYYSNYYSAMAGASGTYSLSEKLTVNFSAYGGYLSPLGTMGALADSLGRFPQMDKSSKKGDGKYAAGGVELYVSYRPAEFLRLTAGKGKKFVGDGYRSVILSASN